MAVQLDYRFGCDPDDLTLGPICGNATNCVLEAVATFEWNTDSLMTDTSVANGMPKVLGVRLNVHAVEIRLALARVDDNSHDFDVQAESRVMRTSLKHISESATGRTLVASFVWGFPGLPSVLCFETGQYRNGDIIAKMYRNIVQ